MPARPSIAMVIRDRTEALFKAKAVSQVEFANGIGVHPSWVSQFLSGRRAANDIEVLSKIARYFGVTVGYLLNETDRGRDAGAATLLAIWEELNERDRDLLLDVARTLRTKATTGGAGGGGAADGGEERPRSGPGNGEPPRRKRR